MSSDRIEKQIVLNAPRDRVWRAIAESGRFGTWFGVDFAAPFVEGETITGRIVPTKVDPEVAKLQEPARGFKFTVLIERIEPMSRFSFRWHPFAIDQNKDYSKELMTLVTFELSDAAGGTLLKITESGFDQLPADRRDQAFKANDGGWTHQTRLIEKYLASELR